MRIMSSPPVWAVFSYYQPHVFKSLAVLCAGGNDVNAGGVDAAVTEDVGELGDVLFNAVKCAGKQMTEIMRKYFAGVDICVPAKLFHFAPDIRAADELTRFGDKDRAGIDMMPLRVFQQLLLKIAHDDDRP